jgi:calcium-dependent protein kinase
VYRVEDKLTGEIRACKKVNKKQIKRKDRFKNEIDLLKSSDHHNIVKLFEIYEDQIFIYLVMEECKGGELFDILARRAKTRSFYNEREAAKIFKQIMSAIFYLHNQGVCHRDLKPENILFFDNKDDYYVKLIDFGLSKLFSTKNNHMNSIVGTIYYMSPEIISGTYNEKCDVWSAGVILYILLCGKPPFFGKSASEITQKILEINYSFGSADWKSVSAESRDLLQKIFVHSDKRLSSSEVLEHAWVKELAPNSLPEILNLNFQHILEYSEMNKIQKSIISFICYSFTFSQTKILTEIFKSLDKNSDGVLTLAELKEGLDILNEKTGFNLQKKDLILLFESIDLDRSGTINYNEFLASTMDIKKELKLEHIYEAFKSFDSDKSGRISLREITDVIKPCNEDDIEYLNNLISSIDLNGDGEIDFQEFLCCLGIPVNGMIEDCFELNN